MLIDLGYGTAVEIASWQKIFFHDLQEIECNCI